MPLYEYVCEDDGSVVEVMRPMRDADAPLDDPDGRGRTFVRKMSTFAAKSSAGGGGGGMSLPTGGCCPCGKTSGGCGGKG